MQKLLISLAVMSLALLAVATPAQAQPPPSPGIVQGHVFGATSGDPVPLEGATVRLVRMMNTRTTQTDTTGAYSFANVGPAQYSLQAAAAGYSPQMVMIQVTSGGTIVHDFTLQPSNPPPPPPPPAEPGIVEGHVFGAAPSGPVPLQGATVHLGGMGTDLTQQTDATGLYRFENVPPGGYNLSAGAQGYTPQNAMIQVTSGATVEHDFTLQPGTPPPPPQPGIVQGHVFGAAPSGPVPLQGATVHLGGMGTDLTQQTDATGLYRFENVPPGGYNLSAGAQGYTPQNVMIQVTSGATVEHDFTLQPGTPPPPPQPGIMQGHVFGAAPSGPAPLQGASVHLQGMGVNLTQQTDTAGLFRFENVPAGGYMLSATAQGCLAQTAMVQMTSGATVEHDFTLQPAPPPPQPGIVQGHVFKADPSGPIPLQGATVRLQRMMGTPLTQQTDAQGLFHFESVPTGFYRLSATAEGYMGQSVMIQVASGATVEHDFTLAAQPPPPPPPGSFAGHVWGQQDNATIPLPGALVQLFDAQNHLVRQMMTNREGAFGMPKVPPGAYRAVAAKPGWQPSEATVEIVSGQETQHDFTLTPQK